MELSWILPAAETAYKHRDEIMRAWDRVMALVRGKKSCIAFTGTMGVGKSALFDYLTGRAYARGYRPRGTSQAAERGEVLTRGSRMGIYVVPGQPSRPRRETLDDLFGGKRKIHGVVHGVANGFITLRCQVAMAALKRDAHITTLEQYTQYQKRNELDDLGETCDKIRNALGKVRQPSWMIVAVTKIDLFYDEIAEVQRYYSPEGDSEFITRMRTLEKQVGTDNFRWEAVPVCSWLEDFQWNGEVQRPSLNPLRRDHFLAQLVELLESYCAG